MRKCGKSENSQILARLAKRSQRATVYGASMFFQFIFINYKVIIVFSVQFDLEESSNMYLKA